MSCTSKCTMFQVIGWSQTVKVMLAFRQAARRVFHHRERFRQDLVEPAGERLGIFDRRDSAFQAAVLARSSSSESALNCSSKLVDRDGQSACKRLISR